MKTKSLLAVLFLTMANLQTSWAQDLDNNYAYVLAGVLNKITPDLGESQSLKMMIPCATALTKTLNKHSLGGGIDDEKNNKLVETLVANYARYGKNIVAWDSTIAEFMEKEVSLEEIKHLDSITNDNNICQAIINSEKITNEIFKKETQEQLYGWAKSWFVSELAQAKRTVVHENKCDKTFKKEFEVFYQESGIKEIVATRWNMEDKSLNQYLQKNLYRTALNKAIKEISEDEIRLVNEQYRQGILTKYMSVTRNLLYDSSAFKEAYQSFLRKFSDWVVTQEEFKNQTRKAQ